MINSILRPSPLLTVLLVITTLMPLASLASDFKQVKQIYVPAQSTMRYRAYASVTAPGTCPRGCALPEANALLTPLSGGGPSVRPVARPSAKVKRVRPKLTVSGVPLNVRRKPSASNIVAKRPVHAIFKARKPALVAKKNAPPPLPVLLPSADSIAAVQARARQLTSEGQFEQAYQVLQQALRRHPNDSGLKKDFVELSLYQAQQHLACCQNECAARRIRDALYIDPDNIAANTLLDEAFTKAGLDATNPVTHSAMAGCMRSQGRDLGAIVEYRKALSLKPDAANYVQLAKLLTKYRQYNEAYPMLKAAAALSPYDFDVQSDLGFVSQAVNDTPGAAEAFSRALQVRPENPVIAEALIQLQEGRFAKEKSAGNALALARAYVLSGEEERATSFLNKQASYFPGLTGKASEIINSELERKKITEGLTATKVASTAQKSSFDDFMLYGPTPVKQSANSGPGLVAGPPGCVGCAGKIGTRPGVGTR